MENIITRLAEIEKVLKDAVKKYKNLEIEYKVLKEERDELLNKLKSINVNKPETDTGISAEEGKNVSESEQEGIGTEKKAIKKVSKENEVRQIRMELDTFIADLDQCIDTIQSK